MKAAALDHSCDVAVIGMAGRFPGARDLETFWMNLRNGVESVAFFTESQLEAAGIEPEVFRAPDYVKAKGILEGVDLFDAAFFGMTAREAEIMDPQQRLFLECCWEAVEHAGYDFGREDRRVGVYAGCGVSSYLMMHLVSDPGLLRRSGTLQARLGNDRDFLTTRVSYKLNLRGPSVTVQTACSTSLVAVHLACQALLDGDCDVALAGGVTVSFPHVSGYTHQDGGIWSDDGHCRAFDARARGAVEGNGAGVVVLKRLADAIEAGDCVHAVIKGSAINNDGSTKAGYTAPSLDSQARVVAEALSLANVDARTIGYVEAHGSGTPIGDPIEIEALTRAFRAHTSDVGFCALGSVKSNVGHLDNAAGITSLIKAVLMLEHEAIVPLVHFEVPNPKVNFAASPFYVPTEARRWTRGSTPRRAGVSSLGIGGTNAHVVVEEAPGVTPLEPSKPWPLLALSARSVPALNTMMATLAGHLARHPGIDLGDVATTLFAGRSPLTHRCALVPRDAADAVAILSGRDPQRLAAGAVAAGGGVHFLFPGLGEQYVGMGRDLYLREPFFREQIDSCAEILLGPLGLDLRDVVFPAEAARSESDAVPRRGDLRVLLTRGTMDEANGGRLSQTHVAQPAVFVLEYALARLLIEWGIHPRAMIGYSIGEYAAACVAGVMTIDDALMLVAERARLIQELPGGAMLAVPLSDGELRPRLPPDVSMSASCGPLLTVAAGHHEAVDRLHARLSEDGIACRRVATTHAFHSSMMEPILERFGRIVERVRLNPPEIPCVSNVTGTWLTASEATDPTYWVRHLRETVQFGRGLAELLDGPRDVLLEVGPGRSLSALVRQHPAWAAQPTLETIRDRDQVGSDVALLRATLAQLWVRGFPLDWDRFSAHERRRRIPLPTYPFERKRYWIETAASRHERPARDRKSRADWIYVPVWKETRPPELLNAGTDRAAGPWLVFLDEEGIGAELAERLERDGRAVAVVANAAAFAVAGERRFEIRAGRREDYDRLLRELDQRGLTPQRIVWGAGAGEKAGRLDPFDLFLPVLFLIQAIGERGLSQPLHLALLTTHLCDVTGGEAIHPAKAALWGPCKVAPQEYVHLTCACIDVVVPSGNRERLVDQLCAEIDAALPDSLVAYRGRRWVRDYAPVRLESASRSRFRPGGAYLLVGGLEETGLHIADHLAKRHAARLSLTAPGFPARHQWERWLRSHEADDPVSRRIRRVLSLEAAGVDVLVLPLDVAVPEQATAAVRHTLRQFGALNGVICAAAVPGAGLIQFKTPAMASAVFSPRTAGTLALADAVKDLSLDLFVVCSSTSAVAGGIGQVDVCAADAFVESFARSRNMRGEGFTSAIHWSPFQWDTWQVPGSAAVHAQIEGALLSSGIGASDLGEVLESVLARGLTDAIVSPLDLHAVLRDTDAFTVSDAIDSIAAPGGTASHSRPELSVPYVCPQTPTEGTVASVWEETFGVDGIGRDDNFFELAGTSLLAIQIVTRLRRVFEVELPVTSVFEAPTIAGLAARIDGGPSSGDLDDLLRATEGLTPREAGQPIAGELEAE